jgi:hypothetical protein
LERSKVLVERGWNLLQFDTTPYLSGGSRLLRAFQHRLLWGPDVIKFNRDLVDFVVRAKSVQAVWIDKGQWVFPSTLEKIKAWTGALLVHYTPDPTFIVHTSRHFERSLSIYDLCVTTKRYELERYHEAGAKRVVFTWQGIDDRFVRCERCAKTEGHHRAGIVFIGHSEHHYETVLASVSSKHQGVQIYGSGWQRYANWEGLPKSLIKGGPVWGREYVSQLANARIGLGLLSKYCQDQFTTRSFEIPAAGTMLIAERTEEHQELFEEGNEAEFFATLDELNDKIGFYLGNEPARCRIAEKGRRRTLACYHWKNVLVPVIEVIEEIED